MSKNVLISIVGKGRQNKNIIGYQKTRYEFPDGSIKEAAFFGSALYDYLCKSGSKIDKWLIFGTKSSSWSEIESAIPKEEASFLEEIYLKVYREEQKEISEETLKEWERSLEKYLTGLKFLLVKPEDTESYFNYLLEEITDEPHDIIFDMTHGFRHMPTILAFTLMALKFLRKINSIKVYYGALEFKNYENNCSKVLTLDFVNDLIKLTESLAIYQNSGYFPEVLNFLGIKDTENSYFKIEMNRQPKSEIVEIINKLEGLSGGNDYKANLAMLLEKELTPLAKAKYLEDRMIERAKYFLEKKQFLKAIVLLYEGLIIQAGRKIGVDDLLAYESREKIRKVLKNKGDVNSGFKLTHFQRF